MTDVELPGALTLSDRAREILRRADAEMPVGPSVATPPDERDAVLDIVQEAIDAARQHLMDIHDLLERIAGQRSDPPM